jgi:hypothetical protein
MKNLKTIILVLFALGACKLSGQSLSKTGNYFGDQIVVDSTSTIMLPVLYDINIFSSSKMGFWGDYYANIIFYNFKADSSKKLFPKDTYINSFNEDKYYSNNPISKNISKKHVLYRVHNIDHNKNSKIDQKDPSILYVSDRNGDHLIALTTENENVISYVIYNKEDFALIKIQRDSNKDQDFDSDDNDFYYVKLDLKTLKFGNKIEIK